MKKNCSKCKGFHEPPFGKYCRFQLDKLCAECGHKHIPSLGVSCVQGQPSTMSKDGKPVIGDFPSRDDPKYLQLLEEQYMLSQEAKSKDSEMENLVRRLDALEKRQAPVRTEGHGSLSLPTPMGAYRQAGTGLGLYASTGARPKTPLTGAGGAAGGMVGGAAGGVAGGGGPPRPDPPAADTVVGPLTEVLEKLTIAVDPSSTSKKLQGMVFKPEFYVQHIKKGTALKQVDHTKLTYRDMVFGWFCVLQHLIKVEGDIDSYITHCRYVSQQAMASQFTDSAYVGYDRHVVEKVLDGESDTFVVGDNLGVATFFHAGNLATVKVKPKVVRNSRWGKRTTDKSTDDSKSAMPDSFPDDICYSYNFKRCTGSCTKKHVCKSCGGHHRAIGCEEKEKEKN